MHDPRHNRDECDSLGANLTLNTRQYPNRHYQSASLGPLTSWSSDIDPDTQIEGTCKPEPEFTAARPWMRHKQHGRSSAHETLTQSHDPDCQHLALGNAFCPQLKSSNLPTWTNPPPLLAEHLRSDYHFQQTEHSAINTEAAQMQSNSASAFVPRGSQGQNIMSTEYPNNIFSDQRDIIGRSLLTPHSSYVTTPDSVFSIPHPPYSSRYGSAGIATPNSIVNYSERVLGPNSLASTSQIDSKVDAHFAPGRSSKGISFSDGSKWPALDRDQTNASHMQDAQAHQYATYMGEQSLTPSVVSPQQLVRNHQNTFSSNQVYVHNNAIQPPPSATNFDPMFASELFTLSQPTGHPNVPFNMVHNPFLTGGGPDVCTPQSTPIPAELDFNNSPLYPTAHHAVEVASCDLPKPRITLPTQNHVVNPTVLRPSRGRTGVKDADMDKKLVKWRAEGLTYREIMKKGNWGLEESTLRGRYRTLTKNKDQRLRKPVWDNASVSIVQYV